MSAERSDPPRAYALIDVEVTDPERFGEYVQGHQASLSRFGGRFREVRPKPGR